MKKFTREAEPQVLTENWEEWGKKWESAHAEGKEFRWPQVNKEPVNRTIVSQLKQLTQDHCSFCEAFPVAPPSIDTIEHFRPKSKFPRIAYKWDNLYFCCMYCQQKFCDFSEDALQPDSSDYTFERYFIWDHISGELVVNPNASEADQRRATTTINLYRLNIDHPRLRRLALRRRVQLLTEPLDELPYRSYLESIK
jgi:uncharacterized protein (TIGR02646 family)